MRGRLEAVRGAEVVPVPPPLYFAVGWAVGLWLDGLLPLPMRGRPATAVIGVAVAAVGLALGIGGVVAVIRHRTTIVPHHPVATLVTTGVYRLSRNPMYTGLGIAYLGAALLFGSWWPVVLWPPVILAVHRLAVRPEERYLSGRFGREYDEYRERVRRWL